MMPVGTWQMAIVIGRRQFISGLGGAVAWPFAVQAQQPAMPVIGFLSSRSPGDSIDLVSSFRQGLNDEGVAEERNVAIEFRWANGHYDQLAALSAELAMRSVNVIVAAGGLVSAKAAKAATPTIPVVFVGGGDPVEDGLVESLSHPGGNITGVSVITSLLGGKRIELLSELVPKARIVAMLVNPNATTTAAEIADVQAAARSLNRDIHVINASTESEFAAAFANLAKMPAGAIIVGADPFFNGRRDQLVALVTRFAIPAIYSLREFAVAGGLASYGTNVNSGYRLAGQYAAKILKGTKPSDLPVQQSTTISFVINLKTAKALGLTVPPNLIAIADEVIE
jgi:putative ABC transport system substrate-binding protein